MTFPMPPDYTDSSVLARRLADYVVLAGVIVAAPSTSAALIGRRTDLAVQAPLSDASVAVT